MSTIEAARDKLAGLAQRAELTNDPMAPYIDALATMVGVLPDFAGHANKFDAALIERVAEEAATEIPLVLRQEIGAFIKYETRHLALRATLVCFGIAVGAFLAGAASGYFYQPSFVAQVCRAGVKQIDPKTQRPACSVSVWADR